MIDLTSHWQPTCVLRFHQRGIQVADLPEGFIHTHTILVLQQQFKHDRSGAVEWRDVPIEKDPR